MISLKDLRKNPDKFKTLLGLKNDHSNLNETLNLDAGLRKLKTKSNNIRSKRNRYSELIGMAKKNKEDSSDLIKENRLLGDNLKKIEQKVNEIEGRLNYHLFRIPNLPMESVPRGLDQTDNAPISGTTLETTCCIFKWVN